MTAANPAVLVQHGRYTRRTLALRILLPHRLAARLPSSITLWLAPTSVWPFGSRNHGPQAPGTSAAQSRLYPFSPGTTCGFCPRAFSGQFASQRLMSPAVTSRTRPMQASPRAGEARLPGRISRRPHSCSLRQAVSGNGRDSCRSRPFRRRRYSPQNRSDRCALRMALNPPAPSRELDVMNCRTCVRRDF